MPRFQLIYPTACLFYVLAYAQCIAYGDDSLVVQYNFDQGAGETAKDLSSYGNDGKIVKAEYLEEFDGRQGVLRFDGEASVLNCPDSDSLYFGGDLSFEMWARLNGPVSATWCTLYNGGQHFAFFLAWWHSLFAHYSTFNYDLDRWESMVLPVDRAILSDQWSHIAVVVEYPRCRFYHNGALVGDAYMPVPGLGTRYRLPKIIGANCPIDLDEFRLYRRALTASEVAAHAAGEEVPPGQADEATVEAHWYEETATVRLSSKGYDYDGGYTAEIKLMEGAATVAGPVTVPITEAFSESRRYVASHAFSLAGLKGKILDGVVRIHDAKPAFVKEVRKEDVSLAKPDWVDTTEGHSGGVLPPWTPVEAKLMPDDSVEVSVWGRQHEYGFTPFFRQIETRAAEILSEPMRLTARADGADLTWNPTATRLTGSSDLKAEIDQTCASEGGKLQISINGVTEYDGYTIFKCSVTAGREMSLERLILEVPLWTSHAILCLGMYVYPEEPDIPMSVNQSGAVTGDLAFRFSPNVWLGDEERGLCWQAESDQDWHCADEQSAIQILPRGDTTIFRANLVNSPTPLAAGEALHYEFALLATPMKPLLRESWDLRIARSEPYGGDLDLADKTTDGKPTLQYYAEAGVRHLFVNVNDVWPWPMPIHDAFCTALDRLIDDSHRHGLKLYPYLIHERVPTQVPEFDIHGRHMSKHPVHQYVPAANPPGDPRPGPITAKYGANSQGTVSFCAKSKALQDAYIHSLAQRLDTYGEDGVYLDGTGCMVPCQNTSHGCGYQVKDAPIHPTYAVFANREFMRRIYTVVKSRKPDGVVDVHQSFGMNTASLAYADMHWTGEHWFHLRKTGTDYIHGELTLDMFRTEFTGYQLGVASETLHYRLGASHADSFVKVSATSLLHDVPVRVSSYPTTGVESFELILKIWEVRERFGAEEEGVEKLFYWNNRDYVRLSPAECYALLLKHPTNGVLAFVSNLTTEMHDVTVQFNLDKLNLRNQELDVFNALTKEPVAMTADGKLTVPLESENWIYVWLRPTAEMPRPH